MATLRDMALPVTIWPMPVEIPSPIRFDKDTCGRPRPLMDKCVGIGWMFPEGHGT